MFRALSCIVVVSVFYLHTSNKIMIVVRNLIREKKKGKETVMKLFFNMRLIIAILVLISSQTCVNSLIPDDLTINISSIKKCQDSEVYPVEVYNIVVNLKSGKIVVTGTLTTSLNLASPIKAVLKIEKDWGAWIEVPCINSIGSCTYDDLCIHSIPNNETCPENFKTNNIPCRCPISKGNYTIPANLALELDSPQNFTSVYCGKYWARVLLSHNNLDLSCYEVYFQIEDANMFIDTNHLEQPFVKLI